MPTFDRPDIARSILEMLPVGVCVIDTKKKIVIWSDGAERITGHLRHEVIGHSCIAEALLHCDQPGCEYCSEECPVARALKTAQPVQACGFVHHKAGHQVGVRVRAVVVRNAHGSIIGAVETFEEAQATSHGQPETFGLQGSLDESTGLASRAVMQLHLLQAIKTFENIQIPFAVLCFRLEQLDHFRASFGPEAAASLLHVVARTLEGSLWKTDFVGRWSDDSFLVILNGCREDALRAVRDRVQRLLADSSIAWWGERRSVPMSIGQATMQAGDTPTSLMRRVEQSLNASSRARACAAGSESNPISGS